MRTILRVALTFFLVMLTGTSSGAESTDVDSLNWCGTYIVWEQEQAAQGGETAASKYACPQYGPCDDPEVRDSWSPDAGDPITYIRLAIHYLANSNGSNPITNQAEVQHAVNLLNQYYLPSRIQFDYVANQVNVTDWRVLSTIEIDGMKMVTALDPEHYLNVWVTQVDFGYSFGTFPFSSDALEATGGIVLGSFHWGQSTYGTFAHEIGHNLGLWHTFNGVDEVTECGSCYERVDASDRDVLGDRCSDTPPTPTWRQCSSADEFDPCSSLPWGYTQPENFMGYVPHWCRTMFTPQQMGRMHCWIDDILSGWKTPLLIEADATFGEAPFGVTLSTNSFREINSWLWDFGDQGTSSLASPTHTYADPGLFTVAVEVQTAEGFFEVVEVDHIWVEADTMLVDSVAVDSGEPIRVDVAVTNYVPLREMIIPVVWSVENDLELDSISTVGLRTSGFEVRSLLDNDPIGRRAAIQMVCTLSGQPPYLSPGNGAVLSLFFSSSANIDDTTRVEIAGYGPFSPIFTCEKGFYEPDLVGGAVFSSSCCRGRVGDANYSEDDEPTVGDISVIVEMLFLSGAEVECLLEADINQSGGANAMRSDITVGDVSTLVDYLFITGPLLGLPDCM